jgi:protein-disulfide isomerase
MLSRRHFLAVSGAVGLVLPGFPAQAETAALPVELVAEIDGLKARSVLGAKAPDVILYEFFDYNCGYCRQSALDLPGLLAADAGVRYVLVHFAVLSEASILAHRIALAFLKLKPARFAAFHQALFAARGLHTGETAIEVAVSLGAKEKRLLAEANSEAVSAALLAAVRLGDAMGFSATPSYVGGAQGHVGFLDSAAKTEAIAALRRCEKLSCG